MKLYNATEKFCATHAIVALVAAGCNVVQRGPLVVRDPATDREVVIGYHDRRPFLRPVESETDRGKWQSVENIARVLVTAGMITRRTA